MNKRALLFEGLEQRNLMAWVSQGPFSSINGQVEGITNRPVSGAIHAVIAHPTDPNILYAGSINGGVWKTSNATSASPSWIPTTDNQSSNSIGALAFDQADPTSQTVWAGNGLYGSFGRRGGPRAGLLRTTDGAATWTRVTGGGVLVGKNISGIVANGSTIVVSVNLADTTNNANTGIFRSINGGTTFAQINNTTATNGLPFGRSFDLVVDPLNPSTMYTSLALTPTATDAGIYKSSNGGATWARVSNAAMNALFAANTSNAEIAAGRFGEVYASIINAGVPAGLFRSPDGGANWVAMDLPSTNENGIDVGLNPGGPKGPLVGEPDEIAGGQGAIHFSMVADPTNANIVYVGGDRQPRTNGDAGTFPNSIGANNFSGRLFRGDASQPAGSQWVHLTHRNDLGAAGGGTASNSAPHADSRDMTFDANGNIVEVDDGGIYRRTNPRSNTGNWFSLNGNIAVTEFHDIAYDRLSNTILGGTQDNGNASQNTAGAAIWNTVSQGDGGDVVIDELTLASSNQTIRYTSSQNLGGLTRRTYNAAGTQVNSTGAPRTVVGGGAAITPAFRTPLQLNAITPSRLIIQGTNSTYESLDQANTVMEIGPGLGTNSSDQDAIVYGGRLNGSPNPEVLYVGSGTTLSLRTTAGGSLTPTPVQPVTATIRDIVVDPDAYTSIALLTVSAIQWSTNAGASWTNITGNLGALATGFRSLAYIPGVHDMIVAGTGSGIFATTLDRLGVWYALGSGFPVVPAYEMEYDAGDNILVVGTLGRGAWTLSNASSFRIDVVAPTVPTLIASGSLWSPSFIDGVDGGGVGAGNGLGIALTANAILPNIGIDRIYLQFSEPVSGFNTTNFNLLGVSLPNYSGVSTVSYDAPNQRGVIQLSSPISRDKIRIGVAPAVTDILGNALDGDSNGTAGGSLDFRFNVLVGDADASGSVNGGDLPIFATAFNTTVGNALYNSRADWNSDGSVNGGDLPSFASNFNVSLPAGEPGFFGASLAAFGVPFVSAVDFLTSGTEYEEVPLTDEDEVDYYFSNFVEIAEESKEVERYVEEGEIEADPIDETTLHDPLEYKL